MMIKLMGRIAVVIKTKADKEVLWTVKKKRLYFAYYRGKTGYTIIDEVRNGK